MEKTPSQKSQKQRLHDLNTVYLDFKIVLQLLQSGHRFDDESSKDILKQLNKALELLKEEISLLENKPEIER